MLNIFNKPYPFNDDLKRSTKIIFFTSLGVFVFLFLFQPFEISTLINKEKYYFLTGLTIVTFLSFSFNLLVIPSLFPKKFSSQNWNIKKEILWDSWILFTTLAGYFIVNNYLGVTKISFTLIIKLVLIATVPITAIIVINHNQMLRSHLKLANELSKKLRDNKNVQDKIVYFNSDYQKDSLAIKVNFLILIRSANNYIEVFWKEANIIKSQLVRCSLACAEDVLKEYKFILKCHRSYVVNVNYIDKIEGNSQGYRLYFEDINFEVPVSKNSVSKLKEMI